MPAIEFIYYHNLLPAPLKIHNNGHSVSLITPKPDNFTEFPFIFGGKLRAEFEFVGLHFHWGDKNNRGSVSAIERWKSVVASNKLWRDFCHVIMFCQANEEQTSRDWIYWRCRNSPNVTILFESIFYANTCANVTDCGVSRRICSIATWWNFFRLILKPFHISKPNLLSKLPQKAQSTFHYTTQRFM